MLRLLSPRLLAILTFAFSVSLNAQGIRPNVVLIMLDDFGYECVTANGGESYQTPVMDRLAATGVRLEQLHVQPLCTPTRAALMTGRINKHNYTRFGHLDPSQKTFGNMLRDAGYATCITGKWQLGGELEGPGHFGFEEYCLWQLNRRPDRYRNAGLEINGKQVDYSQGEYGPDVVNEYALDFIQRKKEGPFFLYYPMMLTHSPYDATPDSPDYGAKKVKTKGGDSGHFADMVAYADKLIGKLIAKLDELKVRENTLVLILGDNGTGKGVVSRFQGREVLGGKGTSTMWGTRVPGICSWPGQIGSGLVCRDLIDATDFLPTICEAAGVKVEEEWKIDGRSMMPQLRGERGSPREAQYLWYSSTGGAEAEFEFAQDASYKLHANGRFYHLAEDDMEKMPLDAAELDEAAKVARAKLEALLKEHEGPREAYFVKQGESRNGGKSSGGQEVKKGAKTPTTEDPRVSRYLERDADRDGKITFEEFKASASAKAGVRERFDGYDSNRDGVITQAEFVSESGK